MTILTLVGELGTSLTSEGGKKSQEGQHLIVPNIGISRMKLRVLA